MDRHVLFWILAFNQVLEVHPNGSHDLVLEYTLVTPHLMQSVALVLNPRTGHVSPQFHVVFDDHFTTVPFMEKNEVPPHWAKLIENLREKVTEEHYELAKTWLFPDAEPGDISLP